MQLSKGKQSGFVGLKSLVLNLWRSDNFAVSVGALRVEIQISYRFSKTKGTKNGNIIQMQNKTKNAISHKQI